MDIKLAWGNVRRSLRDYSVYFLTLGLATLAGARLVHKRSLLQLITASRAPEPMLATGYRALGLQLAGGLLLVGAAWFTCVFQPVYFLVFVLPLGIAAVFGTCAAYGTVLSGDLRRVPPHGWLEARRDSVARGGAPMVPWAHMGRGEPRGPRDEYQGAGAAVCGGVRRAVRPDSQLDPGPLCGGATGYQIALVRMGVSALIVGAVCCWRGDRLLLRGRQLAAMVAVSLLYGFSIACYMVALGECSAGVVGTVYHTYPLWVLLISALLLRRHITKMQAAAVGMALLGTMLVFGLGSQWTWTVRGVALALGCALAYGVYSIAVARPVLSSVPPTTVFFYGCMATVALSAPFAVGSDFGVWLAPAPLALVGVLAVVANIVPYLLYIRSTRLAGSQDASLLSYIELAVIVAVSAAATGVMPGAYELAGCGLIAAAGLAIAAGERLGSRTS